MYAINTLTAGMIIQECIFQRRFCYESSIGLVAVNRFILRGRGILRQEIRAGYREEKKGPGTSPEYSDEDVHRKSEGENAKPEIYCKCKRPSFGKMIECERCKEWFHYECVKLTEGFEPMVWYCEDCIEKKNKKLEKQKKKKKIHN